MIPLKCPMSLEIDYLDTCLRLAELLRSIHVFVGDIDQARFLGSSVSDIRVSSHPRILNTKNIILYKTNDDHVLICIL